MTPEYKTFFSMLAMRFSRGFVAGAISSMVMLFTASPLTIEGLLTNYRAWTFAVISGAVSGALLACDKWIRSDGTDYQS